ncbi:nucleotidyltransferase family protein [bacterium]|nr:nucleotidyltransferase family protein [bacterium]
MQEIPREKLVPVVLAAGASSRMGSPKAALALGGRSVLRWILDACAGAGLARAVVVAGADEAAVRGAATGATLAPLIVMNARWELGRSTSIKAGLAALGPDAGGFLLWPVDVPLAGAALERLLVAHARRKEGERAWVPSHEGSRGHPILFDRSVERELVALSDDEPARDVVRALAAAGSLAHVVVSEPGVLWNMNTREDHERLEAEIARRASE